jgi:HlyD family secretion protein
MTGRLLIVLILSFISGCYSPSGVFHGYVEGDYVYIAPSTSGILKDIFVSRGDSVVIGQDLFALDCIDLESRFHAAQAKKEQAEAIFNNLVKGLRVEDIEVILNQKNYAQALLEDAEKEFYRAQELVSTGAISCADFDGKKASFKAAQASFEQIKAQLIVARLGARDDEKHAAKKAIEIARQECIQLEKKLKEAAPIAIKNAFVEDVYFRQGEFIQAGQPVVSLLPPENIKVRFFIEQKKLGKIEVGNKISISFDGSKEPTQATITYISSQAEYTPPVIYSLESRQKLVFMVEATPVKGHRLLHP